VYTFDCGVGTSSEAWLKEFREHKINSFHLHVRGWEKELLNPDGSLAEKPDFSRLTCNLQRAKSYANYFVFETHCFRGADWPMTDGGRAPYMSELWRRGFTEWLTAFMAYLEEQGIPHPQWLWYPYDESIAPGFLEQTKLVHQIDPHVQIFVDSHTTHEEEFEQWAPHVAVWCPGYADPATSPHVDWVRRSGAELWNYFCGVAMRPINISLRHRRAGWQGWAYDLDGITFWTPTAQDHVKPMDCLVISAVFEGPRGILGTRRWEAWRDGLEDYQ